MQEQKSAFQLPEDIHFINCAYMSPLLRTVEEKGIEALIRKRNPTQIKPEDFFNQGHDVRHLYAAMVDCAPENLAIIPSVSYGISTALKNIKMEKGKHAITVSDEFPSGYFALERWCATNGAELKVIHAPKELDQKGKIWNEHILEAINIQTSVVLLSAVHWMDGTRYDLQKIGVRCKEVGAILIVDGTQTVGALPLSIKNYHIDVLICAAYKWLLGPYSIGMAYYGNDFLEGIPLEESWMNRTNAHNFSQLTNYDPNYFAGAARYNMGEYSNFIHLPMLKQALTQVAEWKVSEIQDYCKTLIQPLIQFLEGTDIHIENEQYRANHLFCVPLPDDVLQEVLLDELQRRKIFVSVRGKYIRIAPHVYNTEADITALIEALEHVLKNQ